MAGDTVDASSFWTRRRRRISYYRRMQRNHSYQWKFIQEFIVEKEINSVLEIGCGLCPLVRDLVTKYQGVDLNTHADAIHANFLDLDVQAFVGWDLLLAANVIEHAPTGYVPFINQVVKAGCKWAIITFFNGLEWVANSCRNHPFGFPLQVYSRAKLEEFLRNEGLDYEIRVLTWKDTVLIIRRS